MNWKLINFMTLPALVSPILMVQETGQVMEMIQPRLNCGLPIGKQAGRDVND
jgi:hypothetical protein